MKQKLLELLTAKFLGKGTTRKDVLARLASAFATQCATEEEAQALINKVTVEQVTDFEKEHRSEVDSEIAKATKTALENAGKGKGGEGAGEGSSEPGKGEEGNGGEESEIAKALKQIAETQKTLADEINSIKAGKTIETRLSRMEEVLKDVNPELKAKTLKDFGRMSFENDESFEEYLTETTTDIQTINQTIVNQGLAGHRPGNGGAGSGDTFTEADYDAMV
ncbi:hypothetical protein IF125_08690 [Empedobacter stercoris]|uniref:hypothetical protein n=1 Tax=Empedobacter stercoris TaxID=1628248 RepID=UPI001CE09B03|nr:hypothetical protein [Empedobacter stercoris]MCA4782341.1 hypothetical protein [Empedobacter stercoris]